jgi:hypothetical protein
VRVPIFSKLSKTLGKKGMTKIKELAIARRNENITLVFFSASGFYFPPVMRVKYAGMKLKMEVFQLGEYVKQYSKLNLLYLEI